jgi:multiple sugar transport system ATP-binding protein
VAPQRVARLGAKKGQPVVLGIRPEDLRLARGSDPADMTAEAVVDVVEPLGAEILLDVKVGQNVVVVRVDPSVRVKEREKIRIAFAPERTHFFDAKTEESLP